MSCLLCGTTQDNVVDIRGQQSFEERLKNLLLHEGSVMPVSEPLNTCAICINRLYNDENANPETASISLRNTDDSQIELRMPYSSSDYALPDFLNSKSNSLTENILTPSIPSSQNTVAVATQASQESQSLETEAFLPPMTDEQLESYRKITLQPGPKTLKRRKAEEFLRNIRNKTAAEPVTSSQEEEVFFELVLQDVQEMKAKRFKPATNRDVSSSSITSSFGSDSVPGKSQKSASSQVQSVASGSRFVRSPSSHLSSQEVGEPSRPQGSKTAHVTFAPAPVTLKNIPEKSKTVTATTRSPPATSAPAPGTSTTAPKTSKSIPVATKNVPSTTKPVTSSSNQVPQSPVNNPSYSGSISPTPGSLPPVTRINDGNAHSNMGAPRRINYSPPQTMTGASSRDSRRGPKLTTGG